MIFVTKLFRKQSHKNLTWSFAQLPPRGSRTQNGVGMRINTWLTKPFEHILQLQSGLSLPVAQEAINLAQRNWNAAQPWSANPTYRSQDGGGGGRGWGDTERKGHGEGGKREVWEGEREMWGTERSIGRKKKRHNGEEKIQGPQTQTPTASQRTTMGHK